MVLYFVLILEPASRIGIAIVSGPSFVWDSTPRVSRSSISKPRTSSNFACRSLSMRSEPDRNARRRRLLLRFALRRTPTRAVLRQQEPFPATVPAVIEDALDRALDTERLGFLVVFAGVLTFGAWHPAIAAPRFLPRALDRAQQHQQIGLHHVPPGPSCKTS